MALEQRFNSEVSSTSFLSVDEAVVRGEEQKKLQSVKVSQTVIIKNIDLNKEQGITVFAYRILQADRLLSTLPFDLKVEVGHIPRSEQNPFGLRLEFSEALKKNEVSP